jgi:hypothetical protein
MQKSLKKTIAIVSMTTVLTACGTTITVDEDASIMNSELSSEPTRNMTDLEIQAYEAGVQDVINDFKGKMDSGKRYVVRRPIVDCNVTIPSRVIGGIYYPEHQGCLEFAPGDIKQKDDIQMPHIGDY